MGKSYDLEEFLNYMKQFEIDYEFEMQQLNQYSKNLVMEDEFQDVETQLAVGVCREDVDQLMSKVLKR